MNVKTSDIVYGKFPSTSTLNTEATKCYRELMRGLKPHYSSLTKTEKTNYTRALAEEFFRLENTRCFQYKDEVLTEIDHPDDLRPRLAQAFREKWSSQPFNGNNLNVASYFSAFFPQPVAVSDEDSTSSQDNISVESNSSTIQNYMANDLEPLPLNGPPATLEEMENMRKYLLDIFHD